MYDEILGETAQKNIDQIDRMIESFGINPQELDKYIISEGFMPYIAKYEKNIGYRIITKNKKTVLVVSALVTLRENLNSALKEKIVSSQGEDIIRKLKN